MQLLYSDILPLRTEEGQDIITDCFVEQITEADRVEIAVGYVSNASLSELESLVDIHHNIRNICLTIGMYYFEGMPEKIYHTVMKLNRKWRESGIGEIRLVNGLKYHGKVYCFYRDDKPYSAIIGSANLGVIKPEASNRRQYEISIFTKDKEEVLDVATHIESLKQTCSIHIENADNKMTLIRERNTALDGIDTVKRIPETDVELYETEDIDDADIFFTLPLKAPKESEKHIDDNKHFTKSNINVCYAAPRSSRKPRDWYEMQLTVSKKIYSKPNYPNTDEPFYVVTDDGYFFKAHTTSQNHKQFSAVDNEQIMGRWVKGRLVAAGIINPVNNTKEDAERKGMVTWEMLKEYGCDRLSFKKTKRPAYDENGKKLDVWFISFTNITENEGDSNCNI